MQGKGVLKMQDIKMTDSDNKGRVNVGQKNDGLNLRGGKGRTMHVVAMHGKRWTCIIPNVPDVRT